MTKPIYCRRMLGALELLLIESLVGPSLAVSTIPRKFLTTRHADLAYAMQEVTFHSHLELGLYTSFYFQVGLIIGKGGETIKNMQASSGARIQVCIYYFFISL